MKNIVTTISLMLLMFAPLAASQSPTPKPAPELKQWDIWGIGDWTLSGTARDTSAGPEYKVDWQMNGHWILGGFFKEVDSIWKGNGVEVDFWEIASYDPIKKIHSISGFASDGTTWVLTVTFDHEKSVEQLTQTSANGEIATCRNTWVFSMIG
jgi:hypothetical protein